MIKTLTAAVVKNFIPPRKTTSRKGQNGKILVLGGSYLYHGAPILSSVAALRTGADLVYTCVPKINVVPTRAYSPNLIVIPMVDAKLTRGAARKLVGIIPKELDSATIGMGLGIQDREALKMLVKDLLDRAMMLCLDASALVPEVLPEIRDKKVTVTPHAGEFQRLFGESLPDSVKQRAAVVQGHAKQNGITILLKGPTDVISDGAHTFINPKNLASMTVGGTGDVLSGIVAAMLSKNRQPIEAASAAAFVNGKAGGLAQRKNGLHIVATDLLDHIPSAMRPFDRTK